MDAWWISFHPFSHLYLSSPIFNYISPERYSSFIFLSLQPLLKPPLNLSESRHLFIFHLLSSSLFNPLFISLQPPPFIPHLHPSSPVFNPLSTSHPYLFVHDGI